MSSIPNLSVAVNTAFGTLGSHEKYDIANLSGIANTSFVTIGNHEKYNIATIPARSRFLEKSRLSIRDRIERFAYPDVFYLLRRLFLNCRSRFSDKIKCWTHFERIV